MHDCPLPTDPSTFPSYSELYSHSTIQSHSAFRIYPTTMKLIVAGSSGYVASEVIRQALLSSTITSVVALGRARVSAPQGTDRSKFKSVVIQDYGVYPDEAKINLKGADACIW